MGGDHPQPITNSHAKKCIAVGTRVALRTGESVGTLELCFSRLNSPAHAPVPIKKSIHIGSLPLAAIITIIAGLGFGLQASGRPVRLKADLRDCCWSSPLVKLENQWVRLD